MRKSRIRITLSLSVGHEVHHAYLSAGLPPGVELAYDGMSIDVADCPESA